MYTFGDTPPWQCDVSEEGIEWCALLSFILLPEVERLGEASHRPQRVVRPVVQFCTNEKMLKGNGNGTRINRRKDTNGTKTRLLYNVKESSTVGSFLRHIAPVVYVGTVWGSPPRRSRSVLTSTSSRQSTVSLDVSLDDA